VKLSLSLSLSLFLRHTQHTHNFNNPLPFFNSSNYSLSSNKNTIIKLLVSTPQKHIKILRAPNPNPNPNVHWAEEYQNP